MAAPRMVRWVPWRYRVRACRLAAMGSGVSVGCLITELQHGQPVYLQGGLVQNNYLDGKSPDAVLRSMLVLKGSKEVRVPVSCWGSMCLWRTVQIAANSDSIDNKIAAALQRFLWKCCDRSWFLGAAAGLVGTLRGCFDSSHGRPRCLLTSLVVVGTCVIVACLR